MEGSSMSPADIAAVVRPNNGYGYGYGMPIAYPVMGGFGGGYGNGFGMDGSWIWILVLLAIFGGFGNGFGGFGGFGGAGLLDGGVLGYAIGNNATKSDLSDGLTSLQTSNKIDNLSTQVGNGFANAATQLCGGLADVTATVTNGANAINTGLLTGFANTNLTAAQNTAALTSAIDNSRFAQQQCCCDIKSEIADSRFAMDKCCCDIKTAIANSDNLNFRNTCDIENMIQAQTIALKEDGEKTRAILVADKIESLNRALQDKDRELQNARFDASQIAQTSQLVQTLQPTAKPSYIVSSPYQSIFPNSWGNNFGFGYGNWGWNQFIN